VRAVLVAGKDPQQSSRPACQIPAGRRLHRGLLDEFWITRRHPAAPTVDRTLAVPFDIGLPEFLGVRAAVVEQGRRLGREIVEFFLRELDTPTHVLTPAAVVTCIVTCIVTGIVTCIVTGIATPPPPNGLQRERFHPAHQCKKRTAPHPLAQGSRVAKPRHDSVWFPGSKVSDFFAPNRSSMKRHATPALPADRRDQQAVAN